MHLGLILLSSLLTTSLAGGLAPLAEETTTNYAFIGNSLLVHARYPSIDNDNWGQEKAGWGTNWQENSMPTLLDQKSTYARLVIEAPSADEYLTVIHYAANAYPLNVYTNSLENMTSYTLTDNAWAGGSYEIPLNLNAGKNVVIFQVNNWGRIESLDLPNELSIVRPEVESGIYGTYDLLYQAAYLEDTRNLFDPEAELGYRGLSFDTNSGFEGAAILYLTPLETTRSLDVDVSIDSGVGATLRVELGNPNNGFNIDLSSLPLNQRTTVHVPSYLLENLGFTNGVENYLRFSGDTSGAYLRIHEVRESSVIDEDPAAGMRFINADDLKGMVEIHGRSLESTGEIPLDWSGSGLSFIHEGSGDIVLNMNINSNTQNTRFAVEVDGEFQKYVSASSSVTLFEGLEEGRREISLYKTSEAAGNLTSITGCYIDENATLTKPTHDSERLKFEFLGDSITCANQVAQGVEDAYQGYAFRLAKAYDADFDAISVSGRGLMEGFNSENGWIASQDNQMKDIWRYQSWFRDQTTLRSNEEPDVMVVSLGSNDLGVDIMNIFGTTIDEFTAEAVSFASTLRSAYPSAKIIFAYGSFYNRDYIDEYRTAIENINDPNIAFVEFPQLMHGDSGHPNELNHDQMASILSTKVAEMLGVNDPYVRAYQYQTYEAEDAYRSGGNVTEGEVGQYWSNNAYVGGMGFDTQNPQYPTSVDEINDDLSNISYLRFTVNAPVSANYTIRVGFSTNVNTNIGFRLDQEAWQEYQGWNSGDWCGGHGYYETIEVRLAQGQHTLTFTSALNNGGWLNYDFINLVQGESLVEYQVNASTGTGYRVVAPEVLIEGADLIFSVELEDNYSQSSIVVSVNDQTLSPQSDGSYLVSDVHEDINIEVSGVELNVWEVRYFALTGDTEPFAVETIRVGDPINIPDATPTRAGYRFVGWDIPFEEMPNGNINVYAQWEEITSEGPIDSEGSSSGGSSSNGSSSSEPQEPTDPVDPEDGDPINVPAIVGGVVGGVCALALIGRLIAYFVKKRK